MRSSQHYLYLGPVLWRGNGYDTQNHFTFIKQLPLWIYHTTITHQSLVSNDNKQKSRPDIKSSWAVFRGAMFLSWTILCRLLRTIGSRKNLFSLAKDGIGHGQKGGNHLPTVAVRWHHMFSVTSQWCSFLSSFLCVIWKKANLYKIWPNRLKHFFTKSCIISNTEQVLLITFLLKTNHRKIHCNR